MEETHGRGGRGDRPTPLIVMVVLGSLWGLSEVVFDDAIRSSALLPYRAGILVGVGMLLMGLAVGSLRKPWVLLGMPVVAILMKQMAVPILGVRVLCEANSCLAIALQGAVLAGVVSLSNRRLGEGGWARVGTGASAGLLSAVPFYFAGLQLAPCPYLLSFDRPGGLAAFMLSEGLVWAIFSGILLPVGYRLGVGAKDRVPAVGQSRPVFYYAISAAIVGSCWVAAALTIAGSG